MLVRDRGKNGDRVCCVKEKDKRLREEGLWI